MSVLRTDTCTNSITSFGIAASVPINEGGSAVIQARAIPLTDNGGNGSGGSGGANSTFQNPGNPTSSLAVDVEASAEKAPEIRLVSYEHQRFDYKLELQEPFWSEDETRNVWWHSGMAGHDRWRCCYGADDDMYTALDYIQWVEDWPGPDVATRFATVNRGPACDESNPDSDPCPVPHEWPDERCWVLARGRVQDPFHSFHLDRCRTAETRYALHTGGRAAIANKSLFALGTSAEGAGNPWWPEKSLEKHAYEIAWQFICVGSLGFLDDKGSLYVALPDNRRYDVTPLIDCVDFYTFAGVWCGKMRLKLDGLTFTTTNVTSWDYRDVLVDTTGQPYEVPHWRTNRSHPALYVSGARMSTIADFDVKVWGFWPETNIVLKGKASNGLTFLKTNTVNEALSFTCDADGILQTSRVDCLNPLTIAWEYSIQDATPFLFAGKSTNQIYVTLKAPTTENLFHTVAHLACAHPGATDDAAALANTWSYFAGPGDVQTWNTRPLHYYRQGFDDCPRSLSGLLNSDDGNCEAWAELLHAALQGNGIEAQRIEVTSGRGFGVKTLSFAEPPDFPSSYAPYDYARPSTEVSGIPGQNTVTPAEKLFGVHWIVLPSVTGVPYYDPSYGVTVPDAQAYKALAIDAWRADDLFLDRWAKVSADENRTLSFTPTQWPN